jgi:hypothetical protein
MTFETKKSKKFWDFLENIFIEGNLMGTFLNPFSSKDKNYFLTS